MSVWPASTGGEATPTRRRHDAGARRRRVRGSLWTGATLIGCLVAVAIFAPVLAPDNPDAIGAGHLLAGSTLTHLLGTDQLGRDVLSRLLYAYRVSLAIGIGSVAMAFVVGVPVGVLAGYRGGWLDMLVMRPIDMMLAFPALLLAFTLITIFGAGTLVTLVAIAVIFIPVFARVTRSSVLTVASMGYIDAARARGASNLRIIARHVLPNAIGPAVVQASILAGIAIQLEAALSFVGLGAQPPTPSLGVMLADGRDFFSLAPGLEIYPGLAIAISVIGFLLIGQGLRERLDPRGILR